MQKNCYNYKQIFEQKTKIRKVWFFTFTNGIDISRFVLAVFIALLMFAFFNGLILFLDSLLKGLIYVIYLFVPYKVSGWIMNARTDGQSLSRYLKDLALYLMQVVIPKRAFCDAEAVELSENIVFEKVDD